MVHFSQLVVEQRWIKEIDINPLLASADQLVALDARILLHGPEVKEEKLPKLAVRPYPSQYVGQWKLKDGGTVTIRPIRPEDEPMLVKFHETLSESTIHYRYFHLINLSQRVAHERLTRVCCNDYDREMALVVDRKHPKTAGHEILGVGRLIKIQGTNEAEFAILISDQYQRHGLGTELLHRLVEIGKQEGVHRITADILPDNRGMLRVCEKIGFTLKLSKDEEVVKAGIEI
jgi:acetyltransferase